MANARRSRCWSRSLVIGLALVLLLGLSPSIAVAAPDEPRSLTVDPSSGPPGTSVTVRGTGWDPEYYSTGVRVGFYQNFGNGVLTSYADERTVQPNDKGRFSFDYTIPDGFADGDILTFSGLIGNGGGERANFTIAGVGSSTGGGSGSSGGQAGSSGGAGTGSQADLKPTSITYDQEKAKAFGAKIYFDSGIENGGGTATEVFNIKWFVDGKEVGAYGSHAGVPASTTVLDGNSQFEWSFAQPGEYEVKFLVDADGFVAESDESNNSTSVKVTAGFDCVRGPNGGCNNDRDAAGRTDAPTWNTWLNYLDELYSAGGNVESGVSCSQGVVNPKDPSYILGCLGIMTQKYPALGPILNAIGCGTGANVGACIGTSLDGLRLIIATIRSAAQGNADLARFLDQPMY